MQPVQDAGFLEPQAKTTKVKHHSYLKWSILSLITAINGYATILMYAQGETAFALLTVVLTALAVGIFGSNKTYAHRYIYPGIAGMIIFIIFPLLYTVGLAFTNYSANNQLTLERAQQVLLDRTYQSGKSYAFDIYEHNGLAQVVINDDGRMMASEPFSFGNMPTETLDINESNSLQGEKAPIKVIAQNRHALRTLLLETPNGEEIRMSSLRKFAAEGPQYTMQADGETLFNNQQGVTYKPNYTTGYYQPVDEQGEFVGKAVSPGFVVDVGWKNFTRVLVDDGIKEPFVEIFIWTIVFAFLAVALTLAVGLVLACIVQWEPLKGSGIYRVLLILPYAVPSFISILIFKGLFNQSFGEINMMLEAMFGISPSWFSDPLMARMMVVIVNTWLGFPYMMILCMGLLKSIPDDLYEASAIDGAGPVHNFFKITLPMMMKPMAPLLIASFAFNFNNFVMIQLLTTGGPNMVDTSVPAGYTDLLVSYTYRIAFEGGGGQDFGLAGAIATMIFLMVGGMALLNLRFTKLEQD
ncbi:maltose ABC transporter permease MalF [Vibrio sp. SM6]|uniref:Maltose/maltodextrin transport system permease protein n=1 Tax=Vibrio agarilyticus TaxID=2726741 RepID=A0A7X8TNP7_9VIBR|nr:maltose ABC transporter permease MalF [Vibrio agarilyticus]NLS11837.1 maltose ABC transporter permease MalF [Vibrio agarilyticus]